MASPGLLPLSRLGSQLNARRARLVLCLSIYGGALGAAALLVSLLARTRFPQEPEHMPLVPSVFLSGGGAIAGAILAGIITYWAAQNADNARNILVWALLGFGYGIFLPFLTGMLIPTSTVFLDVATGIITPGEMPSHMLGAVLGAPAFAFTQGVFGLFTGLLAGALFAAGAWPIDAANASGNRWLSRYGPYSIALALSVAAVSIATFGPPDTLAKLG